MILVTQGFGSDMMHWIIILANDKHIKIFVMTYSHLVRIWRWEWDGENGKDADGEDGVEEGCELS